MYFGNVERAELDITTHKKGVPPGQGQKKIKDSERVPPYFQKG